jgi:hypothetical protein
MDATAISLCRDNLLPIIIFNLQKEGEYSQSNLWSKNWYLCRRMICLKKLIFQKFKDDMEKTIIGLSKSFSRVRTGRASISLLDGIKVDYYGTVPTPISQVANISIPESRLILIVPWDASIIGAIEKAIQKSDLGLTPSNDGKSSASFYSSINRRDGAKKLPRL